MTNDDPFIYQYLLQGDRTAKRVTNINPAAAVEPGCTLWQHLDLGMDSARPWLESSAGLDSIIVESLSAEETRPRSLTAKDGLVVVLRGVNMNPGDNPEDMVSIRLWIQQHRVISAHRRPMLPVTDIVGSFNNAEGPRSSGEFLTTLVQNIADRIGDFVNRIEEEMGEAEDQLEHIDPLELRTKLGTLRRQIASVRRFLAPQRDALDRLNHVETEILSSRDRQRLREESDRVSRYLEDLDLARERAVVLQEAFLSQMAQEQNTRMYVLSIVAAIFLPLTFVTGLLGMNVGGLPGLENAHGFLIATVVMLGATALVIAVFKWKKWI
ncbi:MAG: zinc transporter ZntB [Gammaproteobacteria bacterium]|nr:zinc transporter ZntB [Gammaproteobacteria bacterium]